jgi:hypothetical protein
MERQFETKNGILDLSFHETDSWERPDDGYAAHVDGHAPYNATFVVLGDEQCGPVMLFQSVEPGFQFARQAPAHGHASDTWRVTLKGEMSVGKDRYPAGALRLQEGWRPYGGDNPACGPDGGSTMVMFADHRGTRIRVVHPEEAALLPEGIEDLLFVEWMGIHDGDQVTDDLEKLPGPTGALTALGDMRGGRVNSSFNEYEAWPEVRRGNRLGVTICGDEECGPVVLTTVAEAGELVSPAFETHTELVRVIVEGECLIGGSRLRAGDIRVHESGSACEVAVAGPSGVKEFIVFGDRRNAFNAADDPWSSAVSETLGSLREQLRKRESKAPSGALA